MGRRGRSWNWSRRKNHRRKRLVAKVYEEVPPEEEEDEDDSSLMDEETPPVEVKPTTSRNQSAPVSGQRRSHRVRRLPAKLDERAKFLDAGPPFFHEMSDLQGWNWCSRKYSRRTRKRAVPEDPTPESSTSEEALPEGRAWNWCQRSYSRRSATAPEEAKGSVDQLQKKLHNFPREDSGSEQASFLGNLDNISPLDDETSEDPLPYWINRHARKLDRMRSKVSELEDQQDEPFPLLPRKRSAQRYGFSGRNWSVPQSKGLDIMRSKLREVARDKEEESDGRTRSQSRTWKDARRLDLVRQELLEKLGCRPRDLPRRSLMLLFKAVRQLLDKEDQEENIRRNYEQDLEALEKKRLFRREAIERAIEAENVQLYYDYQEKKSKMMQVVRNKLLRELRQTQEEYAMYLSERVHQWFPSSSESDGEDNKVPHSNHRPTTVHGPHIVYMLKDEEIEEDLREIVKGTKERSEIFDLIRERTVPNVVPEPETIPGFFSNTL